MFTLLILPTWARFAACRDVPILLCSPLFQLESSHTPLLLHLHEPFALPVHHFSLPHPVSISTTPLLLSPACYNLKFENLCCMKQFSWRSFNFWLTISSLAYLWWYLVDTDITTHFTLSTHQGGTTPCRLTCPLPVKAHQMPLFYCA